MTRLAGPLPTIPASGHPTTVMVGQWRAVVEVADPVAVSVPSLTGQGVVRRNVEVTDGITGALTVGDRVWVVCIEGNQQDLLVTGRRS